MPSDRTSWTSATRVPALAALSLHVWRYRLRRNPIEAVEQSQVLSPDEIARALRFHFPVHRDRYVTGRVHLRKILAHYQGTTPAKIGFDYAKYGKPSLARTGENARIAFNVSHSEDLGVLAVGRSRNLGIDVEAIRQSFGGEEIAELNFAPAEFDSLRSIPVELRPQAFFNCWTRKEAYIKALGAGLQIPLDSFEVSLLPDAPAEFRRGVGPEWKLLSFSAGDGFQGALVYDGAETTPEFFDADSLPD